MRLRDSAFFWTLVIGLLYLAFFFIRLIIATAQSPLNGMGVIALAVVIPIMLVALTIAGFIDGIRFIHNKNTSRNSKSGPLGKIILVALLIILVFAIMNRETSWFVNWVTGLLIH